MNKNILFLDLELKSNDDDVGGDDDHHYEHAQIDFSIAVKLIGNRTGIIIVDDTDVSGVIRAYVEFKEQFAHRIAEEVSAGGSTQVLLIKEI